MSDSTSYTYDAGDRILTVDGVPYAYDNRGNLTSDGTWTYTYDGTWRMVRAEKPGSVHTYTYNGDGLLVAESIDGVETVFTWDLALAIPQVLATSDGTRNLYGLERRRSMAAGGVGRAPWGIGVEQGGAWRYTLADALGSVRQWTDPAGAVLGVQSYGPFGEAREPVGTPPWGYTGEWQDPAGMVYLRARWYDAALGRFTQVDPFPGVPGVPATLHPYAYVLNDPLNNTDPSGEVLPIRKGWCPFCDEEVIDYSGWPEWLKGAIESSVGQLLVGLIGVGPLSLRVSPEEQSLKTMTEGELLNASMASIGTVGLTGCPGPGTTSTKDVADELARRFGQKAERLKEGAYRVVIPGEVGPYMRKGIEVRVMPAGSGGRTLPYFRVTIPDIGALDAKGMFSQNRALTHFDFAPSDAVANVVERILDITRRFVEGGGTGRG